MKSCKEFQKDFASHLLESNLSEVKTSPFHQHLSGCEACSGELKELRKTMSLLDAWEAPRPSPYFDQKMAVMLREEQAKAPAGWLERIREQLLFNTGRQFRPAMAGALALAMLLGGGVFASLNVLHQPSQTIQASAAVDDLQRLDKDEQAIQQMDQLLQDDSSNDSDANSQPTS